MIPRLNRLPSTHIASSFRVSSSHVQMRFVDNSLSYHRFAFVVSKKIDKTAVGRNRMKRLLRESVFEASLPYSHTSDIVCIVTKNFLGHSPSEIKKEVADLMQKGMSRV